MERTKLSLEVAQVCVAPTLPGLILPLARISVPIMDRNFRQGKLRENREMVQFRF